MLRKSSLIACGLLIALGSGCPRKKPADEKKKVTQKAPKQDPNADPGIISAYQPLPKVMASKDNPLTPEKIALGRMLYFDKRLSKNHDISCNSCHMLDKYGVDGLPTSPGHKKQLGTRNSPTVYNAAGHVSQFWDGREPTVEAQAKGPVLNPVEMAMKDAASVVKVLESIPGYVEAFKKAFPKAKKPVTYDNMAKAIGAFERKLVTPSAWDKYLGGDKKALTKAQRAGFKVFAEVGCPTCHVGAYVGGNIFQKLGLRKPWPDTKDKGRFEVTKKDEDKMMFKVPSLRNIDKTAPYFHDGKEKELAGAIKKMAEYQLAKKLDDKKVASITAFLAALTGPLPTDYIKEPKLPESSKTTPKPDPS